MNEESKEVPGDVRGGTENAVSRPASRTARTFKSAEIFADTQEVIIEHEGEQYRLRSTRKGKLILTK